MTTKHSKESRLLTVFWQIVIVIAGFLLLNKTGYEPFMINDLDTVGALVAVMSGSILIAAGVGIAVRYYRSALAVLMFGLVLINGLFFVVILKASGSSQQNTVVATCFISNVFLLGSLLVTRIVMNSPTAKPIPDWLACYYQTGKLIVSLHWGMLALAIPVFVAVTMVERGRFTDFAHKLVAKHSTGVRKHPKCFTVGTTYNTSGTDRFHCRYFFGVVKGRLEYEKDHLKEVYAHYQSPLFFFNKTLNLESDLVFFPDKELEKIVRKALSKPDGLLYESDLTSLTSLDLPVFSISNLKGLERASNLESLDAGNNDIFHIRGLEKLSNLRRLNLFNNPIDKKSFAILAQMEQLSELNLGATPVEFVTGLKNLKALTKLNLYNLHALEEPLNLEWLNGLNTLEVLNLSRTRFINASSLTELEALKTIDLGDQAKPNVVKELENSGLEVITAQTPVTSLSGDLRALVLKTLRIEDRKGNKQLPLYQSDLDLIVFLKDDRIRNISGIDACRNLDNLVLRFSKVRDLSPLRGLTKLKHLDLSYMTNVDFSAVKYLTRLERLDFSGGYAMSDLSPLQGLVHLKHLNLSSKWISNIGPLRALSKLESLNLSKNKIQDISALSGMPRLTILNLEINDVSDISALATLSNLTSLVLDHNKIEDIAPLSNLGKLVSLNINHNQINELKGLKKLYQLRRLQVLSYTLNIGGPNEPGKTNQTVIQALKRRGCRVRLLK